MSKVLFIVALTICMALANAHIEADEHSSRSGQYYYYNPRGSMTCDIFPRICRAKGSPGPDCCRKRCVDVMADSLNCGWCGRRCRYGEACCEGECVSIMYDARNCGGCNKRCEKGDFCKYGMCSYA